jgi:predicted GIY-YIG superfamily endonuclease
MNPAPSDILGRCRESKKYSALYMGYTNDMKRRLEQKEGAG